MVRKNLIFKLIQKKNYFCSKNRLLNYLNTTGDTSGKTVEDF